MSNSGRGYEGQSDQRIHSLPYRCLPDDPQEKWKHHQYEQCRRSYGNAGQCNYSASKAGLIGLTKSLAREVAGRSVRVNAIAPGFIESDMTRDLPEKVLEEYKKNIPLGRMGSGRDIAEAVLFLASEKASYITGQVLNVDGGMVM